MTGTVVVSERFYSIQGEGPWLGRPCFFVRLGRCDLDCPRCDSAYTWRWRGLYTETPGRATYDPGVELGTVDVDVLLSEAAKSHARRAVITGGEPMLQRDGLQALAFGLNEAFGILVALETNGRHKPSRDLADVVELFVVSPKLPSFGIDRARGIRPDVLRAFADLAGDDRERVAFKFVAVGVDALDEIQSVVTEAGLPDELVWVMPEGTTEDAVTAGLRALAGPVIDRGWNLTSRLHISIWGDRRGT